MCIIIEVVLSEEAGHALVEHLSRNLLKMGEKAPASDVVAEDDSRPEVEGCTAAA